jgi:hypothetical protein
MMLSWYLSAWLAATVATFLYARMVGKSSVSRPHWFVRGWVSVLAGGLWPLLAMGVLELVVIRFVAPKLSAGQPGECTDRSAVRRESAPTA